MKLGLSVSVLSLIFFTSAVHALSFSPDTIFLTATNKADCEIQGGTYTEWHEETYCTKAPVALHFSDVPREHAHAEAIAFVKEHGIVSGYDDGTFRPEQTINRVELLKILVESEHREEPVCSLDFKYLDTMPEAWYQRYVQVASCLEIVDGYPDGSFLPAAPVLLTEASKMISKAFGYTNDSTSLVWYDNYVRNLSVRGALPTTIETIDAELNRGQVAEMIYRLKTGRTGLASHTLSSLKAGSIESFDATEAFDVDVEIDRLFNELDLDSLLGN